MGQTIAQVVAIEVKADKGAPVAGTSGAAAGAVRVRRCLRVARSEDEALEIVR